ncbi:MAG: TonB-dependent receptor [Bacteroidia bacterium]|nr:TonB-dependent receptor [Bacteroidia bacterium]
MKKFYLLITLILPFSFAFAKINTATVKGLVKDPTGEILPFANVMLYRSADSSLAKAGFTDDDGLFTLPGVAPGSYFLRITFPELKNYNSPVFTLAEAEVKDLGTISMGTPETEIEAVQITAEKPMVTVKPDMTVFNVEGTINAVGEDGFNLLRKAPGVIIDNNDNIMLLGKAGVRVMIDGKPSPLAGTDLANYLKSLQSNQIESIEIITNPSSKYDAEGNAGIVNIRLKKDKSLGVNGSANLGYAIGKFSKYTGGANLNYRNKFLNAFGSYSAFQGRNWNWMEFYRVQNGQYFNSRSDMVSDNFNHNFKGGMDFFLNNKNTLGWMVNGSAGMRESGDSSRTVLGDEATGTSSSVLKSQNNGRSDRYNLNFNLNYGFDNGDGTTLNIDADYGLFRNDAYSNQPNYYYDPTEQFIQTERTFRNETPSNIDIATFKVDHERKLWGGKLGLGIKNTLVTTDNTFNFYDKTNGEFVLNTDRSNQFVYRENVNAAYVNYQKQIKKWNLMAGIRAEQTNSVGRLTSTQVTGNDTVDRHYLNFFPSGGVTYNANQNNSFRLNYSRRIDRPRYEALNPFRYNLNELAYRQGNPFLQPQYTHSLQLTHTFKYTLNTTLSYSYTQDFFTEITDTTEGTRSYLTTRNLSAQEVVTISVSYPFQITKWWSTYSNLSAFRVRNIADFEGKNINLARNSFSAYHQQSFKLPKDFSIQLSGFYNSPGIWGANFKTRLFWGVDLGVQKQFWKGNGSLKLSVSDALYGMHWSGEQLYGGLYMKGSGGWESRQFKANFSYNFGRNTVKQARKRKTGIEDESNRAGAGQ